MTADNIAQSSLIDIVFDGRNKAYGAYQLRVTYNHRMKVAMAIILFLSTALVLASFANKPGKNAAASPIFDDTVKLDLYEAEKPVPPPPPPPAAAAAPAVRQIQFTAPVLVQQLTPEETMPPVADLENAHISAITKAGDDEETGVVAPPAESKGTGLAVAPANAKSAEDSIYYHVQMEAAFPGGPAAWRRYLENNLRVPDAAIENSGAGRVGVRVQFIIDKEGNISNIQALDNPGNGLAEEAVRVIKNGPKWKPAEQNGRKVIYRHTQNIIFSIE